jgi:hypothetical protein
MWNAGEYESFLHELGPDLVFSPDPSFPDAGEYRGEEFRRWMRDWISTWEENRSTLIGWRSSSTTIGHSTWPEEALADSPVKGCMLRSTRLGCLKKPTEEARGG